MKTLDYIILVLFVVAMIVFCFLQQCSLDIYFIVLGFAVAAMAGFAMYKQDKKAKEAGKANE